MDSSRPYLLAVRYTGYVGKRRVVKTKKNWCEGRGTGLESQKRHLSPYGAQFPRTHRCPNLWFAGFGFPQISSVPIQREVSKLYFPSQIITLDALFKIWSVSCLRKTCLRPPCKMPRGDCLNSLVHVQATPGLGHWFDNRHVFRN